MKRLSKLTKGIIAAFAVLPIMAFAVTPAFAFTGQSSEGQFSNIYQIKDETTNGAWGTVSSLVFNLVDVRELAFTALTGESESWCDSESHDWQYCKGRDYAFG